MCIGSFHNPSICYNQYLQTPQHDEHGEAQPAHEIDEPMPIDYADNSKGIHPATSCLSVALIGACIATFVCPYCFFAVIAIFILLVYINRKSDPNEIKSMAVSATPVAPPPTQEAVQSKLEKLRADLENRRKARIPSHLDINQEMAIRRDISNQIRDLENLLANLKKNPPK